MLKVKLTSELPVFVVDAFANVEFCKRTAVVSEVVGELTVLLKAAMAPVTALSGLPTTVALKVELTGSAVNTELIVVSDVLNKLVVSALVAATVLVHHSAEKRKIQRDYCRGLLSSTIN